MSIEVRSERPGDEEAIDLVNCRAFDGMQETHMVRLLREHCPTYDRRFSITASDGDEMVGHALFIPAAIRLMGETVPALAAGPVGVRPKRQRQGIGGEMLRFGHELGRREGFALAFLMGHPSYYPRHGYRACFGYSCIGIVVESLPEPSQKLTRWPVRPADIPWLTKCFAAEWGDVDFSWQVGSNLTEWTLPGSNALIWRTEDGRRAGYSLKKSGSKWLKMLLADDPDLARDVIATVKPTGLEHHPAGWLARNALDPAWATVGDVGVGGPAMAVELQEGALGPYLAAVEAKTRQPGHCNWPLPNMVS